MAIQDLCTNRVTAGGVHRRHPNLTYGSYPAGMNEIAIRRAAAKHGRNVKTNMVESDIWHAAQSMIETHGDQAEQQAALEAQQMLEKGDPAGAAAWRKIITAIIILRAAAPGVAQAQQ